MKPPLDSGFVGRAKRRWESEFLSTSSTTISIDVQLDICQIGHIVIA